MNYRALFLIINFFLISQVSFAQALVVDNSLWTVEVTHTISWKPNFREVRDRIYHLKGQRALHGKLYNVVLDTTHFQDTLLYVRQENDRVLARVPYYPIMTNDTSEFVLYDFGMNLQDSMQLRFFGNNMNYESPWYKLVNSDSVMTVSGKRMRQTLVFTHSDTFGISDYRSCYGDTIVWIEGTGNIIDPFYSLGYGCFGIGELALSRLLCHGQGKALIYQPFGSCSFMSGNEFSIESTFELYPNPTKGILYLTLSEKNGTFKLYDTCGRLLETEFSGPNSLNIRHLSPGLYLLQWQAPSGRLLSKSFVKQ